MRADLDDYKRVIPARGYYTDIIPASNGICQEIHEYFRGGKCCEGISCFLTRSDALKYQEPVLNDCKYTVYGEFRSGPIHIYRDITVRENE